MGLPLALGMNNSNPRWSAPLAFQKDAEQAVMTQVLPGLGHGHSGWATCLRRSSWSAGRGPRPATCRDPPQAVKLGGLSGGGGTKLHYRTPADEGTPLMEWGLCLPVAKEEGPLPSQGPSSAVHPWALPALRDFPASLGDKSPLPGAGSLLCPSQPCGVGGNHTFLRTSVSSSLLWVYGITPLLPLASQVVPVVKDLPVDAGDAGDSGCISRSGRSAGGGNGNRLQYSGLENPMDSGAWRATIYEVTKSQTRLSTLICPWC